MQQETSVLWNKESLDQLRHVMDPDADSAITSIYQSKSDDMLRNTLMQIASNDSLALKEYFTANDAPEQLFDLINNELSREFSDEDIRMFKLAGQVWKENGVQFIYVLFFRALPFTYAAEKPANVLRMTRLIEDQATRRIFETAQFVFDVMDDNWWEPGKRGIITSVKIRLMHAAMRYMLLQNQAGEKWDASQWGMPISQEDLIATNQVFSLEFFKGMEMLGDPLTQDEQNAWFHTWKVIGSIMGIQDDLLMPTIPDAWKLQTEIYNHLFHDGNYAGIGLAKALVGALNQFMLPTKLVLLIMKKMMYDETFPNAFSDLLGPTYGDQYGSLFIKPRGDDNGALEDQLNNEFFDEIKEFQASVQEYRAKELVNQPTTRGDVDKNLVDIQLDEFSKILDDVEQASAKQKAKSGLEKLADGIELETTKVVDDIEGKPNERGLIDDITRMKEDLVKKAMNAVSGVIIDVLSKYFRPGKNAGFRIDANLKEHWALK